jgi:phosphopantetheinyl transferase
MAAVYWLERAEADVPAGEDWLSDREAAIVSHMRFVKRRSDWRLGRWTAKCAVATCLTLPADPPALAEIEIVAAPSGAPQVFRANLPVGVMISLSHRDRVAVCALTSPEVALGCDLEVLEPHSDGFVRDYFTVEEQSLISQSPADRLWVVSLLWSAKESALKALGAGLRLDTRCVTVSISDGSPHCSAKESKHLSDSALTLMSCGTDNWGRLQVSCMDGRIFQGWWHRTEKFVRTLVADPASGPPVMLGPRPCD